MPKVIQVRNFSSITSDDWRVLMAIETGMRNHEYVNVNMLSQFSGVKFTGKNFVKILRSNLVPNRLVAYENSGYRLTSLGYDYLALNKFIKSGIVSDLSLFQIIGTGKESDIYVGLSGAKSQEQFQLDFDTPIALKFHRLGRTSFKQVKNKREYKTGSKCSWIYMNRLSATREYVTMKELHKSGFPIPLPIAHNRGAVVMQYIAGSLPLFKFSKLVLERGAAATLYQQAIGLLVDMARNGLVHGDLNEFNLLVKTKCGFDIHVPRNNDEANGEHECVDSQEEQATEEDFIENCSSQSEESSDSDEELLDDINCPYLNDDIDTFHLVMIDFPQVISRDNRIAQEYYSRDRKCLIDFFGRYADINPTEYPPESLADIERTGFLDVFMRAPGYCRKQKLNSDQTGSDSYDDSDIDMNDDSYDNDDIATDDLSVVSKTKVITAREIVSRASKQKAKQGKKDRLSKQQRTDRKKQVRDDKREIFLF